MNSRKLATALVLWSESYLQDPAGTLPDDDVVRSDVAGLQAIRDRVLHGWLRCHCADGARGQMRLRHALIAEITRRCYHRKAGRAVQAVEGDCFTFPGSHHV